MATCKDCEFGGSCVLLHKSDSQVCNIFTHKKDYVEVVRCKDCKHYSKDGIWCDMNSKDRSEWFEWCGDDFCSYGERRDNENP